MRVTEKGQITIPKELRDELGIGPGSEVEFERQGDGVFVHKVSNGPSRGQLIANRLRRRGDVRMSTDDIMALTRSDESEAAK